MTEATVSARRREEVLDALRRGTVPSSGLAQLAVGLDRFDAAVTAELERVAGGASVFKAVRGEYGSGKTFFSRWLVERARRSGFATAEVQVSETETPLHRLETVYRRIGENLTTPHAPASALRDVVEAWLYTLDADVERSGVDPADHQGFDAAVEAVLEDRLATVSRATPAFAAGLRAYRAATLAGDDALADALLAWIGGQPHVAAAARRAAGVRGNLDHFGAMASLQGLLLVLRDSGSAGLVVVLDEVETLQRARADVRDKALNALRQLIDEVDAGRYPGLYLLITGTPAFFDGNQGVRRVPPLEQRLATDFSTDPRFDNPRAVQVRLPGFTPSSLVEVGLRVRDLYAAGADPRVARVVDDAYVADLAAAVSGALGARAGVAPRLFLKKLVADVLDRVDQFPDFDPRVHYAPTVATGEMNRAERGAAGVDDIDLDLA